MSLHTQILTLPSSAAPQYNIYRYRLSIRLAQSVLLLTTAPISEQQVPLTGGGFRGWVTYILFKASQVWLFCLNKKKPNLIGLA